MALRRSRQLVRSAVHRRLGNERLRCFCRSFGVSRRIENDLSSCGKSIVMLMSEAVLLQSVLSAVVESKGTVRHAMFTLDQYVKSGDTYFKTHGFFEREVTRKSELFAHIAHVFSTYESRHAPDDKKPFERGINSIQLLNDGHRWWILNVLWEGEKR